jgi:hypothetical protein
LAKFAKFSRVENWGMEILCLELPILCSKGSDVFLDGKIFPDLIKILKMK